MGFRLVELGDVITNIATGPFGSNLKVSCFTPSGFPVVDGANLKGYKLTDNITKYVSEEKAASLSRSIAHRGDVVATISGNVGQVSYIPHDSAYPAYLCSQRQFKVTFDTSRVYVPYLVYYLHTREGQHQILSFVNQTGVPALAQPTRNFKRIVAPLPSLEEQIAIARIPELLDRLIELNNQLNGYLAETCDALYSSYTAGEQAADWPMGTLKDLLEIRYGKDHKQLNDGDVPVYGSGGYMRSIERFLFNGESVLIPRKGSLNNVMYVSEKFWTVDTMFYAVPIIPNAAKYAYQFIKRLDLASMNSGSAVPSMTTKILNALPVPIPPKESLYDFDGQLQPYYSKIRANTIENEWLAALRDALLPKLMSGEIDVSEVDLTRPNSHLCER